MPLKPGDLLLNGQYRIEGLLGQGGFGFVYRAHDTHLREDVAVKELEPGLVGDEETLKRFLAEAKATMRLSHDSIVRTHHVFAEGEPAEQGRYYIVMEYMAGGSLEERLDQVGHVPVDDAIRIACQVAEGLAYAHKRGVVHCDLKPGNILFTADPEAGAPNAKVADFGIAHVSDQMLTRTWHTSAGFVAGTLPYMSPEQTRGHRDDPRVDIYALGAVLYHMITGRIYLDFSEEDTPYTLADNIMRIHSEEPLPPTTHNLDIPPWLDSVVLKALQKQPDDRFAAISEFRAALLDQKPISHVLISDASAVPPRSPEQPAPPPPVPDVAPFAIEERPPTPLVPGGGLLPEEGQEERGQRGREEVIPQLGELRGQLARAIEEAREAALSSKRDILAERDRKRKRASEEQAQERLKHAEEAIQSAVERIQQHTRRHVERQVLEEQLAPMLEQFGSMFAKMASAPPLGPLGYNGDQIGPRWRRIGIEMVRVPAGAFLYGDDRERIECRGYYLAKTAVTNAQYAAFVEATGYHTPGHWKKGRIPKGRADHPVVYVSWRDAMAFCEWVGCRLPTEREWEKGARGMDGLEYPWGDEWEEGRCNTAEAGIGGTTPVDRYSEGASPYGLLDTAGNVWEWCADWYEEREKHRVLRGGAWDEPSASAHCANRSRRHPHTTSGAIGFRVAVTHIPSEP